MNIKNYTDPTSLHLPLSVTYYDPQYLLSQHHSNLQIFTNDHFLIPFSIKNQVAKSIDKSPFGSYLQLSHLQQNSFPTFEKKVELELQKNQVDQIEIRHPSSIYSDFVDSSELTKVGYDLQYNDINQHIVLSGNWEDQIHDMQRRKLKALRQDGFEFQEIPHAELETIHKFLTVCRQAQGLQLNISLEKLLQLSSVLPNAYEVFGVHREGKLSAVCITVNVTTSTAYYYLAGTSPLFRSHSPMVLLIAGMVTHYHSKGYKIFDLGVSSYEGQPQETLRLFKERMGAHETKKPTLVKSLR